MKVLSVNVAQPSTVEINGKPVLTGINKQPVAGAVWLRKLGFDGDGQADHTVHGGEHQAAYVYPWEHYAHWQRELGREDPLAFGTFGENLTVEGLLETEVFIGDSFLIGEAVVQVTAPRLPCFKFGHKIGQPEILKDFLHSGHSGFYLRVLKDGRVAAGDRIERVNRDEHALSVRTVLGLQKLGEGDKAELQRALTIPHLAPLLRRDLNSRVGKLAVDQVK